MEEYDAEIENRFTYHKPSDRQIGVYQEVRDEAKKFAYLLKNMCPPSQELEQAMHHLDQTVFLANASIARYSI